MRRFTGHGPRRVAAALVVLALLCVATPIARAWDYVYGDPGPENYSEYEVAALGPDGSTYVIGYFIGEFRGLTSPDAIRYFVEKISTSGAIAWTVPIDGLPTIDPGFQRFPSWIFVDGSGVVYSKTGSTLLTLSDAGEVRARNADLGFYADIDIWPAGGVITTNERVVTAMTPDLDTAWTRDMSDLIDSADMSVKVATDDSVWILGEKKRTTFLGRDALAMVHLDADGALLATIKHYGLQPKRPTSYQSAVIGASSNFLWVWTSGALDGTSAERPHAFSAVDGRLLGEVALDVQSGRRPMLEVDGADAEFCSMASLHYLSSLP